MSVLRDFARVLGGALDGALASWHPSEAVDRAHATAAMDALNEYEANNDGLDPAECEVCSTERRQHPTLISIACGTPGCPNFSEPSAPGLTGGQVERTTPEGGKIPPTGSSSGAPTSTASGGGTASVGNQPLPGAVATPGAGQPHLPWHQILWAAAGYASSGGAPDWIVSAVMDLGDQFEADELDAINN